MLTYAVSLIFSSNWSISRLVIRLLLILGLAIIFVPQVSAHPGRTDSSGGHTCRTNCESWGLGYGEYHSHNGGSAPQYTAPVVEQPIAETKPTYVPPTSTVTRKPTPTKTRYVETDLDKKKLFKVESITDGDTFRVSVRGKSEPVRMVGIDTPESVDPRKSAQCFSKEATNKLSSFIAGKYVKLVDDRTQGNRDKYGRLLRFVYLENGTFVNAEMIKQGYAFSYKQFPHPFLKEFNSYETGAREKEVGLWKACY